MGFVLIGAAPGKEQSVYAALVKVPEVTELHRLFGEYDLIAKVEASDLETLGDIVVNKLRVVEGVVNTKTLAGTKF